MFFTFRPFNGNAMVKSVAFHPGLALLGPLHQHLFCNAGNADDLAKEIDNVFWAR